MIMAGINSGTSASRVPARTFSDVRGMTMRGYFRRLARNTTMAICDSPIRMPGIIAAANKAPIDTEVTAP